MENLKQCLQNEFICYYQVDVIPDDFVSSEVTRDRLAQGSAKRLSASLGEEKKNLAQLLMDMSENIEHPLHDLMLEATHIRWNPNEEDEYWLMCKTLLKTIAEHIEST